MVKKSSDEIKETIIRFATEKKRWITIEEICKELKISRPTAKKYVSELIKNDWLEEEK